MSKKPTRVRVDFESIQPPTSPQPPSGLRPKSLPQNTQTRIAWLLLEDESTRERWGEERSALLSSLTVSNYLMSHSHVRKQHYVNNQHWLFLVLTVSFLRPVKSISSCNHWNTKLMLTLVWPLALSNLFLVVAFSTSVFLFFLYHSCVTS